MKTFKINTTAAKIQLACSKDALRQQFHYIQFKKDGETLEFCATDAHVLIYGNFAGFIGEDAAAYLPEEFYIHADQYKKITAKKIDLIKIDLEAKRIFCLDKHENEVDSLTWLDATELMQQKGVKFPNWKQVIPSAECLLSTIYFDTDILCRALEAMTVPGIPSLIRYGFTGKSKGCLLSHQNTALDFIKGLVMPIYKDGWD
jgi:hypothetical protein